MKKILITIATVIAMLCVLALAGCEHEHEWGEWKTAKEPTCTEKGVEERVCKCGEKETKEIDALGHINGDWIIDAEPTCTSDGAKHLSCTVCSEVMVSGSIPSLGHTEGEWISDTEATCTTDGSKHQICSVCNETIKTETIAATGHTESEWIVDTEATCTADGTKHQECVVCKEILQTESIAALEHSLVFDSFENEGVIGSNVILKCSLCHDKQTTEIKPIEAWASLDLSYTEMLSHRSHREYTVNATGGYGKLQYKFEVVYISYNGAAERPELVSDFSPINSCSYDVHAFSYTAYLQVTIMDEAGNTSTFNFADPGYSMW